MKIRPLIFANFAIFNLQFLQILQRYTRNDTNSRINRTFVQVAYAVRGNMQARGTKLTEQIVIGTPGTMLDWAIKFKFFDMKKIKVSTGWCRGHHEDQGKYGVVKGTSRRSR